MAFIRPVQESIYDVFNPQGLKFLTRLRLGLSRLNEHRFTHNLRLQKPTVLLQFGIRKYVHFLLHCQLYSTFRMGLINRVNQIDENFSYLSDDNKLSLLLYGDSKFDDNKIDFILSASITYILETERFSTSLFQSDVWIFILA